MTMHSEREEDLDVIDRALAKASGLDCCLFMLVTYQLARDDMALVGGLAALLGSKPKEFVAPDWDPTTISKVDAVIPREERIWWARACWQAETEKNAQAPLYALLRRRVSS